MASEITSPPDPSKGRAIVTFGRGWHSLAVARSLASRGIDVVSADVYSLTPSALSAASSDSFTYPDPGTEPEAFLDTLEKEIRDRRPPAGTPYVLQPVQQETYLISEHRQRFEGLIDIALPSHELIEKVRHKGTLARFAEKAGLRVPGTLQPQRTPTPEECAAIDMPVMVKIPQGAGGTGLERVDDREKLPEVYEKLREEHGTLPLVQQLVEGEDICVTAICDHGRLHSVMTYRNSHKAGDSAPGSVRETIAAPAAEAAAEKLLSALEWHGVAQLDFMWDGESEPWLIEINPRLFGGVFQTVASGIDFPWILFSMAVGRELPPRTRPELGVRTETPVVGFLGMLRDMTDGGDGDDSDKGIFDQLSDAWKNSKKHGKNGFSDRISAFFDQAVEVPTERWERVQQVLDDNEDNISQLMFDEDPTAALGLLYPLSIFLKHGRIDNELLHGATSPDTEVS